MPSEYPRRWGEDPWGGQTFRQEFKIARLNDSLSGCFKFEVVSVEKEEEEGPLTYESVCHELSYA